jgi:DNA-binding XRE family transcriptional regulator
MAEKETLKEAVALGERIRKLRAERGISQEAFADLCGLHRTAMGIVERGERAPNLKTTVLIAKGFKITLSELFKGV